MSKLPYFCINLDNPCYDMGLGQCDHCAWRQRENKEKEQMEYQRMTEEELLRGLNDLLFVTIHSEPAKKSFRAQRRRNKIYNKALDDVKKMLVSSKMGYPVTYAMLCEIDDMKKPV